VSQESASARQAALEALEVELSRLFRRSRSQSFRLAREVHPDLDVAGYGMLSALRRIDPEGTGVRAVDVAAATSLHKSTTSRAIHDLQQLGLVSRAPDPDDARAALIRVTDDGRAALERSSAGRRATMARGLEQWSETDLSQLATLLARFNEIDLNQPQE